MRTIPLGSRQGIMMESELGRFLWLRTWLIAHFGVSDDATARAAITLYQRTLHPELVQIHVRTLENGEALSFAISHVANNMLGQAGFWRWRYASVEEADGQYQQTPLTLLLAWKEDSGKLGPAQAALFTTETMIAGKLDSETFFIARRDNNGQWQLYRAWQMECPPDSRAWALGTVPLSRNTLPGVGKLHPENKDVNTLVKIHSQLISGAFQRGRSHFATGRELLKHLADVRPRGLDTEQLAAHIDSLLVE